MIDFTRNIWVVLIVSVTMGSYFIYQIVRNYRRAAGLKKERVRLQDQVERLRQDTEVKIAELNKLRAAQKNLKREAK